MTLPTNRERLLRIVLRVYPATFHARFEDELVQVCLDDLQRPFAGFRGVAFAWLRHAMWLSDALFGIVVFRLGGAVRLGALALALGGLAVGIAPGLRSIWKPNTLWQAVALGGVAFNGVGWILLGLIVALRGQPVSGETLPA